MRPDEQRVKPAGPRPEWTRESSVLRLPGVARMEDLSPEWAWGGATGKGARVAIVDSGIEADHPDLGDCVDRDGGIAVTLDEEGEAVLTPGPHDDAFGHGTACAGIIHRLAPEARLTSVRVLGAGLAGKAAAFLAGLGWAIEQGFDVINLSLGTTRRDWALPFYEVCDRAYFGGTLLVTAANNMARPSYPSLYASVTSVACNLATDPFRFHYNPDPPTEFLAPGIDVELSWRGGGQDHRDRELLCGAAHLGHRGAHQVEAPRATTLPAEDGSVGHGGQRAGGADTGGPAHPDHRRQPADVGRRSGDLGAAHDRPGVLGKEPVTGASGRPSLLRECREGRLEQKGLIMTDSVETTPRPAADYASLAAKLQQFSQDLTPGEASALVLVIEHAKEHATEVTGFEFTDPEVDEVSGFSFSFGAPGVAPGQAMQSFGGLSQFGNINVGYSVQFGGGGGISEFGSG